MRKYTLHNILRRYIMPNLLKQRKLKYFKNTSFERKKKLEASYK